MRFHTCLVLRIPSFAGYVLNRTTDFAVLVVEHGDEIRISYVGCRGGEDEISIS